MDQKIMRDSTSQSSLIDGRTYREVTMIEVEHSGRMFTVCALYENEAKAKIAQEYGFEYNSIRIEGICWYEATDMNYFRFSVGGWHYEAHDFEALELVDTDYKGQLFSPSAKSEPAPLVIAIEGGLLSGVYTTHGVKDAVSVELLDLDNAKADAENPDSPAHMRQRMAAVENELVQIY